jgi:hypothetical protein
MKLSMTGQEKGDLLIQVTALAGLTVLTLTFLCRKLTYSIYLILCLNSLLSRHNMV